MAKRLNKQLVLGLTITGMILITGAGIFLLMSIPEADPAPMVELAEKSEEKGEHLEAMKHYSQAARRARARKDMESANDYLIKAGESALQAGQAHLAIQNWAGVMLSDPQNKPAQTHLVNLYLEFAKLIGGNSWTRLQTESEKLLAIDPENPIGLHALGLTLIRQRAVDETLVDRGRENLEKAVKADPGNPEYANSLASYYLQEDQIDKAIAIYRQIVDEHPPEDPAKLAEACLYRGQFYVNLQRQLANELRQKSLTGTPAETSTLRKRISDADKQAQEDLERAVKLAPSNVDALIGLGYYWQFKQPQSADEAANEKELVNNKALAEEYYKKAIEADPDDFKGYQRLARFYQVDQRYDDALSVIKSRLERGYQQEHYLAWLAEANMIDLRELAFKTYLTKLNNLRPEELGQQEFQASKDAIIAELEHLYNDTTSDAVGGERDARALFMKARLLMLAGDSAKAITVLEEAEKQTAGGFFALEIKQALANVYLMNDLPGPAKEKLNEVLRAFPDNLTALTMLAKAHLASYDANHPQELQQALRIAEEVAAVQPDNRDANIVRLRVYEVQGNKEGAERIRNQLMEGMDPIDQQLRQAITLRLQSEDNPEALKEANRLLRAVLKADPLNTTALWHLISELAEDPKNDEEARKLLEETAQQAKAKLGNAPAGSPEQERYEQLLGMIDRLSVYTDRSATDEEKIARLEEVIKRGHDPFMVAIGLYKMYQRIPDRSADALEQIKKAHELKPDDNSVLEQLFTAAIQQKDWPLAEQCILKATQSGLAITSGGHFYRGRLYLARSQEDSKLARTAKAELQLALSEFPRSAMGQVWLGEACLRLNQLAEAERAFQEATRLNPRNASAAVGLAVVAEQKGDEQAFNMRLVNCRDLFPNHPWVRRKLTELEDRENPEQAIEKREAVRKEKPEDITNLIALADLYAQVGQPDKAAEVYEAAQKAEPTNLIVARSYARLLRSKTPPDFEAAEKMLRNVIATIDDSESERKAATQLLLGYHLHEVAHVNDKTPTPEEQKLIDATYCKAASFSETPEVRLDIGLYFFRTTRYADAIEWFRQALEISSKRENIEDQKRPLSLLIETLLADRSTKRSDELQQRINQYRDLFPRDPVAHLYQGRMYAANGEDDKAIDSYTQYITDAPEAPMGYYNRAMVHLRDSRWEQAIKDFREIKRLDPAFLGYQTRILLAGALEKNGDAQAAIAELQSVLDENPNVVTVVQELVNLYVRNNQLDSADSLVARRAEDDPDNPVWANYRSRVAIERNRGSDAVRFAQQAAEKSKFAPEMVSELFVTYLRFGRFDELIGFVNKHFAQQDQQNPVIWMRLASAYAGKQETAKAIEYYLLALRSGQLTPEAFAQLLEVDVRGQPQIPPRLNKNAAFDIVQKQLAAAPKDGPLLLIAALLQQSRNEKDAYTQLLRELIAVAPNDNKENRTLRVFAILQLGIALHQSEKYEEARDMYKQALELDRQNPLVLNNLAYLTMTVLEDPESALPYSKEAAALAPKSGGILDTLGWNHVLLKQYDEAIAALRDAIVYSPDAWELHYHAAEAFYRRANSEGAQTTERDLEEARVECERAHELLAATGSQNEESRRSVIELGQKLGLTLQ